MNARCLYFHCHSLLPLRHVLLSRSVSGAVVKTCTHFLNVGQQVTIQCRSASNQEMLYLKRGLNEEEDIFCLTDLQKSTINQKFTDRLQFHGPFPNVDILLKNLTLDDTGPYWCVYKVSSNYEFKTSRGNGSVLLVVTGESEQFVYASPKLTELKHDCGHKTSLPLKHERATEACKCEFGFKLSDCGLNVNVCSWKLLCACVCVFTGRPLSRSPARCGKHAF
uniref:Immunoglobulin V-set domain-containing protein n=1 Tax=Pundamilia nyererei TaxID=303518 RepID=A0A3B4GCL0_9CICH